MPTLGRVPDCCARATNGQAVTEPIALINSRRLIEPPMLRTEHRNNPHQHSGRGVSGAECPLWVKSRHVHQKNVMSDLARKRISALQLRTSAMDQKQTLAHSNTSSARPISVLGILRPSVFAVFRLMYSSTLVA